jgi:pimeloyl-ACP methyl ester carboxylesterase
MAASPYLVWAGAAAAFLSLAAFANHRIARRAERANPPMGRFIEIDGVRLHYLERGEGEPLVMLHGNGSMIQDFVSSGLLDMAAQRYRVIVFDRPGFGHSSRPRTKAWTDEAQADLVHGALTALGVPRAAFLGHSWGCSVATALALNHPAMVSALILASGYHYPTVRPDVAAASVPAIPVLGDLMRFTAAPMLARALWPLIARKIFGPAPVPAKFEGFPREMAFRPSQIRASAAESAMMIPDAFGRSDRYSELKMPIVIIAGAEDRLIDFDDHSGRLHAALPQSRLHRVADAGHMIHQTATLPVMQAIEEAMALAVSAHTDQSATEREHRRAAL